MDIRAGNLRSCWRQQFKKNIQLFALSNQNPTLSFLIWNFLTSVFLKEKNFIMSWRPTWRCLIVFYIICTREFPWKKARKNLVLWKNFFLCRCIVWNWQALLLSYPYINFHCTINCLCITMNYELCITKYSAVVSLFIDPYVI